MCSAHPLGSACTSWCESHRFWKTPQWRNNTALIQAVWLWRAWTEILESMVVLTSSVWESSSRQAIFPPPPSFLMEPQHDARLNLLNTPSNSQIYYQQLSSTPITVSPTASSAIKNIWIHKTPLQVITLIMQSFFTEFTAAKAAFYMTMLAYVSIAAIAVMVEPYLSLPCYEQDCKYMLCCERKKNIYLRLLDLCLAIIWQSNTPSSSSSTIIIRRQYRIPKCILSSQSMYIQHTILATFRIETYRMRIW